MRGPHEDPQEQEREELVSALSKLMDSDVISTYELTLICMNCGVQTRELTGETA